MSLIVDDILQWKKREVKVALFVNVRSEMA